jgi:hypothetical protein
MDRVPSAPKCSKVSEGRTGAPPPGVLGAPWQTMVDMATSSFPALSSATTSQLRYSKGQRVTLLAEAQRNSPRAPEG